jgi:hypothetical protein
VCDQTLLSVLGRGSTSSEPPHLSSPARGTLIRPSGRLLNERCPRQRSYHGVVAAASIVVHQVSLSVGLRWLGGLKNTRDDMAMYPSSGYQRPTSSSGCSLYSRAPKSGVTTKEKEIWQGSLSTILRLVGSEVSSLARKKNTPLSCRVARGRNARSFLLACSALRAELGMVWSIWFVSFVFSSLGADLPLIFRGRSGIRWFGVSVCSLRAPESRRALLQHRWTLALSRSRGSLGRLLALLALML